MNTKDTFYFPVKLTENEISVYRTWGLMQQKYRISVLSLFAMIYVLVLTVKYLDRGNVLRLAPLTAFLDFLRLPSGKFTFYTLLMDLVLLALMGLLAFVLIRHQRSINSSVVTQKLITCRIDAPECIVHCTLSRGDEEIEKQDIGIYQATSVCDPFSHTFLLNGISYLVGINSAAEIYPDSMRFRRLLEKPQAFPMDRSDMRVYCDRVRSVIASIEQ